MNLGLDCRAELVAGRVMVGHSPILHITDGKLTKAWEWEKVDALRGPWNGVPLLRR